MKLRARPEPDEGANGQVFNLVNSQPFVLGPLEA
jgi:hypothetical protein